MTTPLRAAAEALLAAVLNSEAIYPPEVDRAIDDAIDGLEAALATPPCRSTGQAPTPAELHAAMLEAIAARMDAEAGTPEGAELDALAVACEAYERRVEQEVAPRVVASGLPPRTVPRPSREAVPGVDQPAPDDSMAVVRKLCPTLESQLRLLWSCGDEHGKETVADDDAEALESRKVRESLIAELLRAYASRLASRGDLRAKLEELWRVGVSYGGAIHNDLSTGNDEALRDRLIAQLLDLVTPEGK